jgi:hypothetical protein
VAKYACVILDIFSIESMSVISICERAKRKKEEKKQQQTTTGKLVNLCSD